MPCPTGARMGLKYVVRPTDPVMTLLLVSWMTWSSGKALSYIIRGSPNLKLVMLKDIEALVNGLGSENKTGDH
jgi:hypothetical protein